MVRNPAGRSRLSPITHGQTRVARMALGPEAIEEDVP